jgi:hypothetical protein
MWASFDEPETTELFLEEDVMLPLGCFVTEAMPELFFAALYSHLNDYECDVSESEWSIDFAITA